MLPVSPVRAQLSIEHQPLPHLPLWPPCLLCPLLFRVFANSQCWVWYCATPYVLALSEILYIPQWDCLRLLLRKYSVFLKSLRIAILDFPTDSTFYNPAVLDKPTAAICLYEDAEYMLVPEGI